LQGKSVFGVNLGVNWKKLKFRDWNWTLKSLIGQIMGLIVKNLKFHSQLRVWMKKFKTKNQIVKYARLQGLKLTKLKAKLKKIESLMVN
jgi:hypothetical protein